jgi:hypothetical protein
VIFEFLVIVFFSISFLLFVIFIGSAFIDESADEIYQKAKEFNDVTLMIDKLSIENQALRAAIEAEAESLEDKDIAFMDKFSPENKELRAAIEFEAGSLEGKDKGKDI